MKLKFLAAAGIFIFLFSNLTLAQSNNRISPMDSVSASINDLKVEIVYSRPFLKGREFGKDIVPYGKVWRTGANEATTFEVSKDVLINNKLLPAGKYSIYTIPDSDKTTVIFNKIWDQWGTQYDENFDVLRVDVPTLKNEEPVEQFTIEFENDGQTEFAWGNVEFEFQIKES